jgi:hypothetical protein
MIWQFLYKLAAQTESTSLLLNMSLKYPKIYLTSEDISMRNSFWKKVEVHHMLDRSDILFILVCGS